MKKKGKEYRKKGEGNALSLGLAHMLTVWTRETDPGPAEVSQQVRMDPPARR